MENAPLVSVIIPTYKRPVFLDRAIDSVLCQTYTNIEVVVVDDNNPETDARKKTEEIMSKYSSNPKVKYIQHECNKNGSAARNTGARNSTGKFIAFLDDDDIYLPNKITSQVARLQSLSNDWGFCYSKYYTKRGGDAKVLADERREGDLFLLALKQELCVNAGSNLLIRREAFDAISGFDESFKRNQDHEFLVRLLQKYKIAYVDEPGLVYSVGTTNAVINYDETIDHYIYTFSYLIDTLPESDKKEFYNNVARLRFYNYIRVEKDFIKAIKLIINGEYSLISAIEYVTSLTFNFLKRKMS